MFWKKRLEQICWNRGSGKHVLEKVFWIPTGENVLKSFWTSIKKTFWKENFLDIQQSSSTAKISSRTLGTFAHIRGAHIRDRHHFGLSLVPVPIFGRVLRSSRGDVRTTVA